MAPPGEGGEANAFLCPSGPGDPILSTPLQTDRRLQKEKAGGMQSSSGQGVSNVAREQRPDLKRCCKGNRSKICSLPCRVGAQRADILPPHSGQKQSQQVPATAALSLELVHFLPSHNLQPRQKCILQLEGCSGIFQKQQRRGRTFPQRGSILVPQELGATWERREL